MINDENLNKLYESVIKGDDLTTKKLNEFGFNSTDITKLIKEGIIRREARGIYSFCDIEKLFYYGKKLIAEKKYGLADKCFAICYDIDPNHPRTCFQLFIRSIDKRDYESVFKYFAILCKTDNVFYLHESNFYLYLLSIITDVPEEYKKLVYNMTYQDICIPFGDKRFANLPAQNYIRNLVYNRKFGVASKELKRLTIASQTRSIQDIVTMKLLSQVVEADIKSMTTIIDYAREKKYEEIIDYLEKKEQRHNLSLIDGTILNVAHKIVEIKDTRMIPVIKDGDKTNVFNAIKCNDYQLAFRLNSAHIASKNLKNEDNPLSLLLKDLCEIINEIKKDINLSIAKPKIDTNVEKDDIKSIFISIINALKTADTENFIISIKKYLKLINKSNYEFLIIDLFKIYIHQKDYTFFDLITVLTHLRSNNYYFELESFIIKFFQSFANNEFEEARIYLDIITNSEKIGKKCVFAPYLLQLLKNTEELYKKSKEIDELLAEDIESLFDVEQLPPLPYEEKQKVVSNVTHKVQMTDAPKIDVTPKPAVKLESKVLLTESKVIKKQVEGTKVDYIQADDQYILDAKEALENGQGMILLKFNHKQNINQIMQILEEYEQIESQIVEDNGLVYIILRNKPVETSKEEIERLISQSQEAYDSGDYDTCVQTNFELLKYKKNVANTYAKIGLSYLKMRNKDLAIKFLMAATLLDKERQNGLDFRNIIESLNAKASRNDRKIFVRMHESEFNNDLENNYGIENLDEITNYIIENGLDVETACEILGISSEKIDIIRILYARMYYSQNDFAYGDLFVEAVEKSPYKNRFTMKLLEETRKNKRFYASRTNGNARKLTACIYPKRKK